MRRAFILSCVASTALAALSLWLWNELGHERKSAAELRAALAELQRASPVPEPPAIAGILQGEATPPPGPALDPPKVKVASTSGADVTRTIREFQERERRMMSDAEYRKLRIEAGRQELSRTRADAIRVVGMSADQADRLIDLWVQRNLWFSENSDLANGGRLNGDAQAEAKRRAEDEQVELRALLGEEKYAAWTRYLQMGSERAEVEQFNSQLATVSAQMSPAVADQLVEALFVEYEQGQRDQRVYRKSAAAMGTFDAGSREARERWVSVLRAANRRVLDRMGGSLTPVQLARLEDMLAAKLVPLEAALRVDTN